MGLTCIVTVHGIGFQQPPDDDQHPPVPGYADHLHELLRKDLGAELGEDPERPAGGPVYVQSSWDNVPAAGLARLNKPLTRTDDDRARFAHIALVYAELEIPPSSRLGSALDTAARALLGLNNYAHPLNAAQLLLADTVAELHRPTGTGAAPAGLAPRRDAIGDTPRGHHRLRQLLDHAPRRVAALTDAAAVVTALEEDVASYVCRNDLRERVRTFVEDALVTLADRDDIDAIVLNTHSQGSVVGFDVLARSHPDRTGTGRTDWAKKVRGLVTAGSPLRKYVDLFAWGARAGGLGPIAEAEAGHGHRWLNIYDRHDPVADPLRGGRDWLAGQEPAGPDAPTLFRITPPEMNLDTDSRDCPVEDIVVDNLSNSSGALRAHNYWDNPQFIPHLSQLVREVSDNPR